MVLNIGFLYRFAWLQLSLLCGSHLLSLWKVFSLNSFKSIPVEIKIKHSNSNCLKLISNFKLLVIYKFALCIKNEYYILMVITNRQSDFLLSDNAYYIYFDHHLLALQSSWNLKLGWSLAMNIPWYPRPEICHLKLVIV